MTTINPFNPLFGSKQLTFGAQRPGAAPFRDNGAASYAAHAAGAPQRLTPQFGVQPTSGTAGAQPLGANPFKGDELARFKQDMASFKGNLAAPALPHTATWGITA